MGLCEKCSSIIKKQTRISEGRMIGWIKEVEEMPGIEKIPEDKFREIFVSNPKNVLSTGSLFIVMVHFIMYIIIYCIKYY